MFQVAWQQSHSDVFVLQKSVNNSWAVKKNEHYFSFLFFNLMHFKLNLIKKLQSIIIIVYGECINTHVIL